MEEYIYLGKIVNTHGLLGEIRILSNFDKKEKVFVPGMHLYIGKKKEEVTITRYRHHKNFEMILMDGYTNIDEVLRFKGLSVFVRREDLKLEEGELLEEDYLGMDGYSNDQWIGKVVDIQNYGGNNLVFILENEEKRILIPFRKEFIASVDLPSKKIFFHLIEGMLK